MQIIANDANLMTLRHPPSKAPVFFQLREKPERLGFETNGLW